MRVLPCILTCILFNATYSLYGQPCSSDSECNSVNEECFARRCRCKVDARSAWNYDLQHECDRKHVDKCTSDRDCGNRSSWHKQCNNNGICECESGYEFIGVLCYKIDKPSGKSYLKSCSHEYSTTYDEESRRINKEVPICHPEDNVFCSPASDGFAKGKCICYPGYVGDPETKVCATKDSYLEANRLTEYKVKPGLSCATDDECIYGLNCKHNFCTCPDGCVYKLNILSCDCGDFYDSDEYYYEWSYLGPSITGTILGLLISSFGMLYCLQGSYAIYRRSIGADSENNSEEQTVNPL